MANLSNPRTQLREFFKQIGRTSAQVAPVAPIQAQLFSEMADTFAAIGHDAAALRATIEKNPPTLDAAIASFRVQRPFLADFADLSRRLRPAAREIPIALPKLNAAFRVGTPVVRRSVILNDNTTNVFNALDDLVRDPNTLLGLKDLTALTRVGAPLLTYLAPYQTVCNYATYFLNGLGAHQSESTKNGTAERVLVKLGDNTQNDNPIDTFAARPAGRPNVASVDAKTTGPNPQRLYKLSGQPYTAAIDAQGNANCAKGQFGYPDGPLLDTKGRYPAASGGDARLRRHLQHLAEPARRRIPRGQRQLPAVPLRPQLHRPEEPEPGRQPSQEGPSEPLMAATKATGRREGISTFKAGLLAAVVIGVGFFGFTRYNPFAHPFQLHATFQSANNLQPKSPVRIAGVDIGKVTEVQPLKNGTGGAKVTMQIDKKALPIHRTPS